MGKAGQALKQALTDYKVSQNRLAVALNVERNVVNRWIHGKTDPTGETIVTITVALRSLNPEAAKTFVYLYLGDLVEDA